MKILLNHGWDFPLRTHALYFLVGVSYYSFAIILVSDYSSCFIIAVSMNETCRVRYTPRA